MKQKDDLFETIAKAIKPFDYKAMEKECETDLKEISHFYGGWDELRKVIDRLEDNDNEAKYERFTNDF